MWGKFMEKITIVINGVGGCGKDTLVSIVSKYYSVLNISSITPAKEVLANCGWDGEKSDRYRKFLSDLKNLMIEFNNYPTTYLLNKQDEFLSTDEYQVMFVHCREGEEIEKFVSRAKGRVVTLLIYPRTELQGKVFGNSSDDCVYDYKYDFEYYNTQSLENIDSDFMNFFNKKILNSK